MIIEALSWQPATIVEIHDESARAKTFRLKTELPYDFLAGQHAIVRVTLADGFKSSRDYSFSSAPSSGKVEITVAKEPDGELSCWFYDTCRVGDTIEITPPLGADFTYIPEINSLLIAGGIGITPLMSMLREHHLQKDSSAMKLLYSARSLDERCFKTELSSPDFSADVSYVITGTDMQNEQKISNRITADTLSPLIIGVQQIYICGSFSFVSSIEKLLIESLLVPKSSIKTEKFN